MTTDVVVRILAVVGGGLAGGLGLGLLAMAGAEVSYLLVAYTQEYLQERASRRAMQTAI